MSSCNELIKSVSVDKIVAQRQDAITAFVSAIAVMRQAKLKIDQVIGKDSLHKISACFSTAMSNGVNDAARGEIIARQMDVCVWDILMNETDMYSIMSHKQRELWDKTLYSDSMPLATIDNIALTFAGLYKERETTYREGIVDVFRNLSWDYATNNPVKVGKKIIVNGFILNSGNYYLTGEKFSQKLNDLARAFYLFDRKPVPDFASSVALQLNDFYAANGFNGEAFEHEFFTIKYYKKGSAHITFKRPEVVDAMNDLIAEMYPDALPAPK